MKKVLFFTVYILFLAACSEEIKNHDNKDPLDFLPNKLAVKVAVNFVKSKINSPQVKVFNNMVIVQKGNTRYEIRPENIFYGLIDADTTKDAFISISSYNLNEFIMKENLILLKSGDSLKLAYVFEEDIDVMKVDDRYIYGEVHKKPRSSPLYNCEECKEQVKYKFENGELIKEK
ncbi:MAG: hypothetical protein U0W24_21815 [Bacteroidales bacterium]